MIWKGASRQIRPSDFSFYCQPLRALLRTEQWRACKAYRPVANRRFPNEMGRRPRSALFWGFLRALYPVLCAVAEAYLARATRAPKLLRIPENSRSPAGLFQRSIGATGRHLQLAERSRWSRR